MIQDEKLARISLGLAVIGIAAIYLSVNLLGAERIDIGSVSIKDSGKQVLVSGVINSFGESGGNIFIDLEDETGSITVVMFERTGRGQKEVYGLQEGDNISVNGQISIYKSGLEIIANKITKVTKVE